MDTITVAQQALNAAASLFSEFAWARLLPGASFVLVFVLVVLFTRAMHRDATNTFDVVDFFRENGKLSLKLVFASVCCGVHTWFIWIRTTNDKVTWEDMALYAGVWSGSAVALEMLAVWKSTITARVPPTEPGAVK